MGANIYIIVCSYHIIIDNVIASVGVTPRIFPTFKIAEKQEELESSVLQ